MATELNLENELKQLRTQVQEGKLIVGKEKVLKRLQTKKIQRVYLAKNCPAKLLDDINHYAQLADVPVITLEQNNEELGIFCKKNFLVAVVGIGE